MKAIQSFAGLLRRECRGTKGLVAAIATTDLKPVIDRVFPMREVQDAFQYLKSGKAFGRVVIKI